MKHSPTLLAAVLLVVGAPACGSGSATHSASTRPVSTAPAEHRHGGYSTDDGDADFDDAATYHGKPANDDLALLASYGRRATPAERLSIVAAVKRYYAAAAAQDGATACSLLAASLADGVAAQAPPGADGRTCAPAMSMLLVRQHAQLLADKVSTMDVRTVRVKGTLALAVLGFRAAPEGEIVLEREGSAWKVDALFGSDMP